MEITAQWIAATFISAAVGGLLGGGVIWGMAYRSLKDRLVEDLSSIFAKRSALEAVASRVTASETNIVSARARADRNADDVIRLQQAEEYRWKPVIETLNRIDKRLDRHQSQISQTATLLDQLEKRMDRSGNGVKP